MKYGLIKDYISITGIVTEMTDMKMISAERKTSNVIVIVHFRAPLRIAASGENPCGHRKACARCMRLHSVFLKK